MLAFCLGEKTKEFIPTKVYSLSCVKQTQSTKTLSNFPWCKDTKFLTWESLCLHFCGVALRVFVSLCLIVLWLFIVDFVELKLLRFAQAQAEPPAPEACRRLTLRLSFASYSMEISRQTGSACWNYMECCLKVHEHAIAYT